MFNRLTIFNPLGIIMVKFYILNRKQRKDKFMEMRNLAFTHFKKGLNRAAFTLAEVLIVITIIGIVAAIVLPTLFDVGNEKIWQNQSDVFGSKMFTALKMMNQRGDLAMLDSTEEFVSNLGKYIRIVKTCPSETAYECFDNKMIVKSGEKPKSVQEMGITTAENLGHDDWTDSNVMGVQFANGISALLAYNTLDCLPKAVNAAENIWDSDIFGCIAMMFDVNSNGNPNEKGSDIRLVNAGGIGSAPKKCVGETCYAFVVPEGGVDCTNYANTVACDISGGVNYSTLNNSLYADIKKSNYVVSASLMCQDIDMHLASSSELETAVSTLGRDYFAQIAGKYNLNYFGSKTKGNQDYSVKTYIVTTNSYATDGNGNEAGIRTNNKVYVCASD